MRKILISISITLCALAILTLWKSHKNDLRAEQTHPPVGQFITVNGTRVHYLRAGQGPVVILLHGAGGNLRDFTFDLVEKLSPHYSVLAFDRPGHGYTDDLNPKGATLAEQSALLHGAALMLGVKKATIAGYSYGGAVALSWALDYPEMAQGLLLMSSVSNPWVKPPSYLYALAAGPISGPLFTTALSAAAPESMISGTVDGLFTPQDVPKGYRNHLGIGLSIRKKTLRANGLQVHSMLPQIQAQSRRYGALTLPVEIIHGGKDTTVPASVHAKVLARQLPHANLVLRAELGHDTQHFAHPEIMAALARITAAQ